MNLIETEERMVTVPCNDLIVIDTNGIHECPNRKMPPNSDDFVYVMSITSINGRKSYFVTSEKSTISNEDALNNNNHPNSRFQRIFNELVEEKGLNYAKFRIGYEEITISSEIIKTLRQFDVSVRDKSCNCYFESMTLLALYKYIKDLGEDPRQLILNDSMPFCDRPIDWERVEDIYIESLGYKVLNIIEKNFHQLELMEEEM